VCCASRDRDSDEPSRSVNFGTRYVYTCVGTECGGGGQGDGKQYIGQGADESVVLGPRFITCVTIVAR